MFYIMNVFLVTRAGSCPCCLRGCLTRNIPPSEQGCRQAERYRHWQEQPRKESNCLEYSFTPCFPILKPVAVARETQLSRRRLLWLSTGCQVHCPSPAYQFRGSSLFNSHVSPGRLSQDSRTSSAERMPYVWTVILHAYRTTTSTLQLCRNSQTICLRLLELIFAPTQTAPATPVVPSILAMYLKYDDTVHRAFVCIRDRLLRS